MLTLFTANQDYKKWVKIGHFDLNRLQNSSFKDVSMMRH